MEVQTKCKQWHYPSEGGEDVVRITCTDSDWKGSLKNCEPCGGPNEACCSVDHEGGRCGPKSKHCNKKDDADRGMCGLCNLTGLRGNLDDIGRIIEGYTEFTGAQEPVLLYTKGECNFDFSNITSTIAQTYINQHPELLNPECIKPIKENNQKVFDS